MSLTHGADVELLAAAAEQIAHQAARMREVEAYGAVQMRVLDEAWQGPDLTYFAQAWGRAGRELHDAGARLIAFAALCREQAQEQSVASGPGAGGMAATGAGLVAGVGGSGAPATGQDEAPRPRDRDNREARGRERDDTDGPSDPVTKDPDAPGEYREGPPQRPEIDWDEDFEYDSADPGIGDYLLREKWLAMKDGAALLKPELDDGLAMYEHYWDNSGEPVEFDYDEAAREDSGVRANIDAEAVRTAQAVDAMAQQGGDRSFQVTGPPRGYPVVDSNGYVVAGAYPQTENWQKAIGGYQQWSSADVTVKDGMVTMRVTVHAEDHYNFNRDQSDIRSGASDNENGRFTELGWAKPFDSSGQVTREITWPVGSPPPSLDLSDPNADPGRGEQ